MIIHKPELNPWLAPVASFKRTLGFILETLAAVLLACLFGGFWYALAVLLS